MIIQYQLVPETAQVGGVLDYKYETAKTEGARISYLGTHESIWIMRYYEYYRDLPTATITEGDG